MKIKLVTILTAISMFMLILLGNHQKVAAAPTGELIIVASLIGNQIPTPWLDQVHSIEWMKLLYDPLVGTTPDTKRSTEAGLAEKFEMSPDGLTWTFHLRKGVKFHDGVEVTAKDVKFSIERMMAPDSITAKAGDVRAAVKSMEIKGNTTLVVQCKHPSLFLPDLFADVGGLTGLVLPKDSYERLGHDKFVKNPIGTGPYKFHSQIVGSFIKLEATDKHWRDGVPRYKYVTFRIIPEESTQIAMLKTGEADIARISRERVKEATDAGLNVISKKNAAMLTFQPNMRWETPAFADLRFRKALTLAIDNQAIIKHIFAGRASLTTNYPGANISAVRGVPSLKPYPYDPEEARRLIKEGGYEGFEFSVPNYVRNACPEIPRIVEVVCGYWNKIGVKPKIFNTEWSKFYEMRAAKKVKGIIHCVDSTTSAAIPELMARYREQFHSTMPRTFLRNPKVDEMIAKAERSLDSAEVEKIAVDLYRYLYDDYVFIPICDLHDEIATTQKVPPWDPGLRRIDRNINDIIRER